MEIDADRAVEAEQVRPDGRARRIRDADAAHAERVFQRPVDKQIAQRVEQAPGEGTGRPSRCRRRIFGPRAW